MWLDARVERVRDTASGMVRQKALLVAYGVHETGRREVIGLEVGEVESEAEWRSFLRSLVARGLTGVQLVISDAHPGLKNAIGQVLGAQWQRCTVHFVRDMLGHVPRQAQPMVRGALKQIFACPDRTSAGETLRAVVDQLGSPAEKVARLLEDAEEELLAYMRFPREHWPKVRSTDEKVKGGDGPGYRDFGRWIWSRRVAGGAEIGFCGVGAAVDGQESAVSSARGPSPASAARHRRRVGALSGR